jgi:hypothetical protein
MAGRNKVEGYSNDDSAHALPSLLLRHIVIVHSRGDLSGEYQLSGMPRKSVTAATEFRRSRMTCLRHQSRSNVHNSPAHPELAASDNNHRINLLDASCQASTSYLCGVGELLVIVCPRPAPAHPASPRKSSAHGPPYFWSTDGGIWDVLKRVTST